MDTEALLREALRDISPVLERHGFKLKGVKAGLGSGGHYAVATYGRGLWKAHIYYRDGLEPGWYRHAWHEMSHSSLLPAMEWTPPVSPTEYAQQLQRYAAMVLSGDWRAFWRRARRAKREYWAQMKG